LSIDDGNQQCVQAEAATSAVQLFAERMASNVTSIGHESL
jgi:hypothetical protein